MRIGPFAQAARTTTRTVRHYHQLGLLPEPPRRANGYREYELPDLVRLLRIIWLARAGIPLARIGDLLAESPAGDATDGNSGTNAAGKSGDTEGGADGASPRRTPSTTARDLEMIAMTMAAERDRLDRQMTALAQIRDAVEAGRALSALPARLAESLDLVARSATGPELALLEQDREMLEVLALSGELTEEMVDAYATLAGDPAQLSDALRIGAAFVAIEGKSVAEIEPRIDDLVEALLGVPVVQQMLLGAHEGSAVTPEDAAFFLPDPAQREVVLRMLRRLR